MEAVPCEQVRQRFYCPRCPKVYKYKVNLSRHLNYECGKEPQFRCPFCPYMAKQKGSVKVHLRNCKRAPRTLDELSITCFKYN